MAIVNALQLEAAQRSPVPVRFNCIRRAKYELAQPIRCRLRAFLLLIHYVCYAVTLNYDPVTNECNTDCPTTLIFHTQFDHGTVSTLQMFKVKGQRSKVKVTA